MRHQLTSEWSIELDATFSSRVVDGDLQLLSPGPPMRSVWVAAWEPPTDMPVAEVVEMLRDEGHPDPTRRYDEPGTAEGERRLGSWYPEEVDGRAQWGLYGYTVQPSGPYLQLALLVDHEEDIDWALATWRSVHFAQPGRT